MDDLQLLLLTGKALPFVCLYCRILVLFMWFYYMILVLFVFLLKDFDPFRVFFIVGFWSFLCVFVVIDLPSVWWGKCGLED